MKRLLNHLTVLVHRGTTDSTMVVLEIDVSTETGIDTSMVRKETGSMRLDGTGMTMAMLNTNTTRRAARPGSSGGPEQPWKIESYWNSMDYVSCVLLSLRFISCSSSLDDTAAWCDSYCMYSHYPVLFHDL